MMLSSILCLVLVSGSSAFLLSPTHNWDDLKVTWGINPLSSSNFVSMPRTTQDAIDQGFTKLSDCDANAQWRGARYIKGGDKVLTLLYDKNGFIAGIQAGIPSDLKNGYPKANLQPPFIKDGDDYIITAYFVDPATICSKGRSEADFKKEGTGNYLYIQNGTNPEADSVLIPRAQSDIEKTMWTEGKCFYTMGRHYWYNLKKYMSCDDFFPVFLLYNGGQLNGFGWAMGADLTSDRLEHPPQSTLGLFFKEIPLCLKDDVNKFSTMHIYLTESILGNTC